MGFLSGIGDWITDSFGFKPIHDFGDFVQDVGSLLSMGMYQADDDSFNVLNHALSSNFVNDKVNGIANAVGLDLWSDVVPSTIGGVTDTIDSMRENGIGDYVGNLFQTDADAALDQAQVNDFLSESAWKRSEESADRAQARARELRQTYYSDVMKGLKDAGLNPVLAASGGFGGVSSAAPQGTSQAATSSKADGLNAANLIQAIASILSGAGSLVSGLNPLKQVMNMDPKGAVSITDYSYGRR